MKEFTCIVCPNGCNLQVDETTLAVTGNKCKRGLDFGIKELTNPERTISLLVHTTFKTTPVVPVKVSKEFPKDKIFDVVNEVNKITIDNIVKLGDVIVKNVCGLEGVDVVVTSNIMVDNYGK